MQHNNGATAGLQHPRHLSSIALAIGTRAEARQHVLPHPREVDCRAKVVSYVDLLDCTDAACFVGLGHHSGARARHCGVGSLRRPHEGAEGRDATLEWTKGSRSLKQTGVFYCAPIRKPQ